MRSIWRQPGIFLLGAAGYATIEVFWRGYTHWTMALTGGTVLLGLSGLRRRLHDVSPFMRCASGAACITTAEFVVGCTVNRHYQMQVWDYSREWGNLRGQICPKYSLLWLALAAPIMLPDWLPRPALNRASKSGAGSGPKFVQGFHR